MRKIIFALVSIFLLVGCSSEANVEENLTIFGRLSQLVQLGSTEETIEYKLPAGDFLITVDGEILQEKPGLFKITIREKETNIVRDDLNITLQLCTAVDRERWGSRCEDERPKYVHNITTEAADGLYTSETFAWDRAGGWQTIVTIEDEGAADPTTATFWTQVYPKRPPSSNAFELTNISLPFIVIGLFLLAARLRKWELIRPIAPIE